tara:strand:- start:355 stop:2844 length:2490 start_codon:yes stop_codon:yes gene_type:complete
MTDKENNSTDLIDSLEGFAKEAPVSTASIKFPEIEPKDYDTDLISNFLDKVFHAGLDDDENILTWMVKPASQPFYPKSDDAILKTLAKTRQPKALYYATAACKLCPIDGKLHHRKDLFTSLRVVVLDDIGTKVALEKIPADFPPSYIIESSAGNFQYGYILDEPVDSLPAAEALIQMVYESGYSDEGGKTPVKLVRMPEGVNGKKGEKGKFISALTTLTDVTYSPQDILDKLHLNVNWSEVLENADDVTKRRASKSLGSSPWADVAPQAQSMNGYIDPVLEYLYETDQVALDNQGEWIEIKCPWGESHTTGSATARYAPLGRGTTVDTRGFKCFHEHCAHQKTKEFLNYIATTSGIQAGVHDPAAELTTRYVFDKVGNVIWDIKSDRRDIMLATSSFATLHPHKTVIQNYEGKDKLMSMTALWTTSRSRVSVAGATYDPSTTARIVLSQGEKFVNLFSIPEWGFGPVDNTHVEKFMDYINYLIPAQESRDYFLMWLAAKCQDMAFKGAAIVMVANAQGVGRSTLADMIKTLMGGGNVADVPLADMVGGSQFNEWQEKPFIVSEETLSADPKLQYNTYEKLKTYVDPRSRTITINPKFGMKREAATYASYLFLSNHTNAIAIPAEDRRFYVIDNAHTPAAPSVFTALNKWLAEEDEDGLPTWGRHVYRWLQTVPVDIEYLTAPPPRTEAKDVMAGEALNDLDFAVTKLMEIWPDPYLNAGEVYAVFDNPLLAGPLHFDEDTNRKFVKRAVNTSTLGYKCQSVVDRINKKKVRPRVLLTALKDGTGEAIPATTEGIKTCYRALVDHYAERTIDVAALADKIVELLHEDDRL